MNDKSDTSRNIWLGKNFGWLQKFDILPSENIDPSQVQLVGESTNMRLSTNSNMIKPDKHVTGKFLTKKVIKLSRRNVSETGYRLNIDLALHQHQKKWTVGK